jgi:Cu+-exporting ATPase
MNSAKIDISSVQQSVNALTSEGKTAMYVSLDDKLMGLIAQADIIKTSSKDAISKIKELGLQTFMITGDNRRVAEAVGNQVGVDGVQAEVLPEDKVNVVKKYQNQQLLVGMVGDGINDAPALAQADIGIAIGAGTDVAKEAGEIVLVKNDLMDVERAIRLGKQTLRKVKQNLFWALFYNSLGIPIAAGALSPWGIFLKPEYAGLAMAMSSVSVVTNSLLLKRFEKKLL